MVNGSPSDAHHGQPSTSRRLSWSTVRRGAINAPEASSPRERGIRTFETDTRNTLDTNAIALAKQLSPYPVIADPSHATGRADLVLSAAKAAVAAGADGLLVEFHPNPSQALSDGEQSLPLTILPRFVAEVGCVAEAVGRHFQ
jgi:3-deoxy-7-phosphoheptulonate synthase